MTKNVLCASGRPAPATFGASMPKMKPEPASTEKAYCESTSTSTSVYQCFVEKLDLGSRTLQFKSPLAIKYAQLPDRSWEASVAKLGIFAIGASSADLLEAVAEDLFSLWDGLAHEPDIKLTLDAQNMKKTLHTIVE